MSPCSHVPMYSHVWLPATTREDSTDIQTAEQWNPLNPLQSLNSLHRWSHNQNFGQHPADETGKEEEEEDAEVMEEEGEGTKDVNRGAGVVVNREGDSGVTGGGDSDGGGGGGEEGDEGGEVDPKEE